MSNPNYSPRFDLSPMLRLDSVKTGRESNAVQLHPFLARAEFKGESAGGAVLARSVLPAETLDLDALHRGVERDRAAPAGWGRQDRSAAARRGWPGTRSGGRLGRYAEVPRRVVARSATTAFGNRGLDGREQTARCH
jgi:hypothetical protein